MFPGFGPGHAAVLSLCRFVDMQFCLGVVGSSSLSRVLVVAVCGVYSLAVYLREGWMSEFWAWFQG